MNRPVSTGAAAEDVDEPDRDRARVLIIDDDERNLLALRMVLEDLADIVTAKSGEAALRNLLKGEFAVILLDVFMPGMDGYETAYLIRQREQSKHIPIIFQSAMTKEDSHLLRGYSMGAVDYVFKPVEPIVLRSKVSVFVDLFRKTREIERKAEQERQLRDENYRIQGEQLATELALRRSEERQALILQSLPLLLYLEPVNEMPRTPRFVSGDFAGLTGFELTELQQQPDLWASRLHPDDSERVIAAYAAVPKTGGLAIEYRWQAKDGRYKHFLEQAVVLRQVDDADDGPGEIAGSLLDVSDRRLLESSLLQAQKMDAVGKLTGGVAHDFNNLLAAVLGGLDLIDRRCDLDPRGRKIVAMTRSAAEQGSELVRRLLSFARRQQLEPAVVSIANLFDSMRDLMAHTLGGLVTVAWQVQDDAWAVLADRNQLELALMNLIINARDAMPSGGTITVSAHNRTLPANEIAALVAGEYVLLSVNDTGIGIAPEVIERVFEPFFTTKPVGQGTGLGLSMVYGFAEQSGGAVRARSTVNKGTTFEFWLPRAGGNLEPESAHTTLPATTELPRGLRILLIDDHEGVRTTTAASLEDLGHEVTDADSGSAGLKLLGKHPVNYDLIVTDYAMPGMSGTELIRRSRQIQPQLPAIIMTGYADREMISDRPESVAVLLKPVQGQQLQNTIAAVMQAANAN